MQVAVDGSFYGVDRRGLHPRIFGLSGVNFNTNPNTIGQFSSRLDDYPEAGHRTDDFARLMLYFEHKYATPFHAYELYRPELVSAALVFGDKNRYRPQHVSPYWLSPEPLPPRVPSAGSPYSTNPTVRIAEATDKVAQLYSVAWHKDTRDIEPDNVVSSLALLASKAVEYWVRGEQALAAGKVWDATDNDEQALLAQVSQIVRVRNFYLKTGHVPSSDEVFANFDGDDANDTIDGAAGADQPKFAPDDLTDPAKLRANLSKAQAEVDALKKDRDAAVKLEESARDKKETAELDVSNAILADATLNKQITDNETQIQSLQRLQQSLPAVIARLKNEEKNAPKSKKAQAGAALTRAENQLAAVRLTDLPKATAERTRLATAKATAVADLAKKRQALAPAQAALVAAEEETARREAAYQQKVDVASALQNLVDGESALAQELENLQTDIEDRLVSLGKARVANEKLKDEVETLNEEMATLTTMLEPLKEEQAELPGELQKARDKKDTNMEKIYTERATELREYIADLEKSIADTFATLNQKAADATAQEQIYAAENDAYQKKASERLAKQRELDQKRTEIKDARKLLGVVGTPPNPQQIGDAAAKLAKTVTRQNIVRASLAVQIDIVERELLALKFPAMAAPNARIRQEQVRKAVGIMREARLRLDETELLALSEMTWIPTLTFVNNRTIDIDTNAELFTRLYEPSQQARKALLKLLPAN